MSPSRIARCITLNLSGLNHGWIDRRARVVTRGLKPFAPDVVCLQESTIRYGPGVYDQATVLGEALDLPYSTFSPYGNPVEVMSRDQGGLAILSRWPFLSARNRKLPSAPEPPSDARVAVAVSIDAPFGPLRVVNLHLSWRPSEAPIRLVQVGLVINTLGERGWLEGPDPLIVAGDFNAIESEPAIELAGEFLVDTFRAAHREDPGYTLVNSNPLTEGWKLQDRRLDYIFCSKTPNVRIRRSEVILNRPGTPYPSDHFAVLSELEWQRAG